MDRSRRVVIVAAALMLALGIGSVELRGAGKGKAPKPPPKPAPKVHLPKTKPMPKPKNPKAPPTPKGKMAVAKPKAAPVVTKRITTKMVPRRNLPKPTVHEFVKFNASTREYSFHPHWWYRFIVYPQKVGVYAAGPVNYADVTPPANVTPPVVKADKGLPLSEAGKNLARQLDGLDVEHHWLPGQQVHWKTGNAEGNGGPASNGGAFVAAVCARFNLPFAEPTAESLLPGSQYDWLLSDGKDKGWVAVGATEAQLLANQGWVVIAAWSSSEAADDASLAGQTAIVRPSDQPATEIAKNGPRLSLAGVKNSSNIALKDAFPAKSGKDVFFLACHPR